MINPQKYNKNSTEMQEVEVVNKMNTEAENRLLGNESNGIILKSDGNKTENTRVLLRQWPNRSFCYKLNTVLLAILGILLIISAISLFKYSLFTLVMTFRLRMTPGLPHYESWANPAPEVFCRAYIFTVTNSEAFRNGTDTKMKLEEIGPIIYREHLEHKDIVLHENSTMSYTVHRYLEFLPDKNEPGILNKTIIVPNIVLLGMATRIVDSMFTVKFAFNMLSKRDSIFVNITINDYFWNFTTPALVTVDRYLPFLVPMDNGGTLHTVYKNLTDRVNVRIGPKYDFDEFFMINTYNYRPTVPQFFPEKGDCFASLVNSTEGAFYPNFLEKDSVVIYWRKAVCRPVPLYFQEEVEIGSITGYKFVTKVDWYDRFDNLTADCYKGYGSAIYPDGLSDASKCYSDLPVGVSAPHFHGRSGYWDDQLEGFSPSLEKHGSYAIIEPITGVPLDQKARSQSNMVMPKLTGFTDDINRFSNIVVPILWLEYHLPKLTPDIDRLLIFTSNILPKLNYLLPVIFLALGILCFYFVFKRLKSSGKIDFENYSKLKLSWNPRNVYNVNSNK